MAFAITKVACNGIEVEEAVNKRYHQYMVLTVTSLAADVALDLGAFVSGSLGTFWTAAGGSTVGAQALTAIRDIFTKAETFKDVGGTFPGNYSRGASVGAGVYTQALVNKTPNVTFNAANGPVGSTIVLSWVLAPQQAPTELYAPA